MPKDVISMRPSNDPEWKRIKDGIRQIRQACHDMEGTKSGIRCFAELDIFQDKLRKVFREKRR